MPHNYSSNYSGRVAVIAVVMLVALLAIFFPSIAHPKAVGLNSELSFFEKTNLKPGIDIVGGTSLLYQIRQPEGTVATPNLAEEVMKALKRRVDPQGVLNLIWRPQGSNRLEIQMPLTSGRGVGETAKRQAAVDQARARLEANNINPADLTDALEEKNGKTRADFNRLAAAADPMRKQMLLDLAAAHDAFQKAQAEGNVEAGNDARRKFDELQRKILDGNLAVSRLDTILKLKESKTKRLEELKAQYAGQPERLAAIDAYLKAAEARVESRGLDSAADLKRLLRGSGLLEFHILAGLENGTISMQEYQAYMARLQSDGPRVKANDNYRWFEVDKEEEFKGRTELYNDRHYVLASIKPGESLDANSGKWALTGARASPDQTGGQVVGFTFDTSGGTYFGTLTAANVGKPMAIMLDGRVISAPNINQGIMGGSGIITGGGAGGFSQQEIDYLVRMLSAGSLPAQLDEEPISERTIGPQLGEDNLYRGLLACGIGLVVVAVFLIGYYYLSGLIAFVAVLVNILIILGAMAAIGATFTLPGIAAIVLTIGTSVDANVLVYERLREEQHRGLSLRMSIRNAYDRAFSAIVDSNMTTVITSFFLIMFGTEEVKGFGIVLIIGILASMFTALFVTRTLFGVLIDGGYVRKLGSLPLSFPKYDKMLKPNVNWMRLAPVFYTFSIIVIVVGGLLFARYARRGEVLDIEFASGTAVTFELKQGMEQKEVRALLEEQSRKQPDVLPSPSPVRVGEGNTTWEVTTPSPNRGAVEKAILAALGDRIKSELPSTFARVGEKPDAVMDDTAVILPITPDNTTGEGPKKWPNGIVPEEAKKYAGGAAIVLKDLDPPLSPKQLAERINRQVLQSRGTDTAASRDFTVVAPTGPNSPATTAIVLTADSSFRYDEDKGKWAEMLVKPMWEVVAAGVNQPPTLQQVKNFDPSVAGDTQRDALIALALSVLVIMAYIWIRFGNLKFGTATVVALLHDVVFVIAAIGIAHALANTWFGDILLLEKFRINLTVVAGILTVMGYSMVDTIVVFDRIRELRGKFGYLNRQVVNDAINQTLSRTLLTAGSTLVMVAIMYFIGGSGIHGFTFVLLIGILVGSYSSIGIAAPIILLGSERKQESTSRDRPVGQLQRAGTT